MTNSKTHSWLSFKINTEDIYASLWLKLGRCSGLCNQVAKSPLSPASSHELGQAYLTRGVHSTTAMEGNTLTENETRQLIEKTIKIPDSRIVSAQEASNILVTYDEIAKVREEMTAHADQSEGFAITPEIIQFLNHSVLNRLPTDGRGRPGIYRRELTDTGADPTPEQLHTLIEQLCSWLSSGSFRRISDDQATNSLIKAIVTHFYIMQISPFGIGNGKTARLAEFTVLGEGAIPAPALHLLNMHYCATREQYKALMAEAVREQNIYCLHNFMAYAVEGFLSGLETLIETIRNIQGDMACATFVQEAFREKQSPSWQRRKQLAIDIFAEDKPVPKRKLAEISGITGGLYANKTDKTLSRDILCLKEMGLITKTADGYTANKSACRGFETA